MQAADFQTETDQRLNTFLSIVREKTNDWETEILRETKRQIEDYCGPYKFIIENLKTNKTKFCFGWSHEDEECDHKIRSYVALIKAAYEHLANPNKTEELKQKELKEFTTYVQKQIGSITDTGQQKLITLSLRGIIPRE